MEKLAALLDRDHKPLKDAGRRKQNIPHKENVIVVMTSLIPGLPLLSILVSSICRWAAEGFSNPLEKSTLKLPPSHRLLLFAFLLLLPCKCGGATINFAKRIVKEWAFTFGALIVLVEESCEEFYRNGADRDVQTHNTALYSNRYFLDCPVLQRDCSWKSWMHWSEGAKILKAFCCWIWSANA